jgi:cytoskeletal protein CcmA (bactofilin family)
MQVKNENGSALVITIFLFALFAILGFAIASYTMQSVKLRSIAEDEIQGKMLADMGLLYFREYMERELATIDLKSSGHDVIDSKVKDALNKIAKDMNDTEKKYKRINVPDVPPYYGSFTIGYVTKDPAWEYNSGADGISTPYSRRIDLTVIGIPRNDVNQKRMKLTTTVYVNTVPAPFHYAVSTPGQLRLYGGTNIIGNVKANSLATSTRYFYVENGDTKVAGHESNKPYVEGYLSLDNKELEIVNINEDGTTTSEKKGISRELLKNWFVPEPLADPPADGILSTNPDTAWIPGFEPPILKMIPGDTTLSETERAGGELGQVKEELDKVNKETRLNAGHESELAVLDPDIGDFDITTSANYKDDSPTLFIQSNNTDSAIPTARLTGDKLSSRTRKLIIGGDQPALVEMGHAKAFTNGNSDTPFTFNGSIYIKGDLDIVGDIDINGTIYVDGNVYIREVKTVNDSDNENDKNGLVIIASGKIQLATRYQVMDEGEKTEGFAGLEDDTDADDNNPAAPEDEIPFLQAYLYSEQELVFYSSRSVNRIMGGIHGAHVELNTNREENDTPPEKHLASHMVVKFDRGIFEKEIPGLPAGQRFHIDIYNNIPDPSISNTIYSPVVENLEFEDS